MKGAPQYGEGRCVTIRVPLSIRKRGGRKLVIAADGESVAWQARPRLDSTLVKAIARAYRWQRLLEEGTYVTINDLAAAEKISPTYVSRLLRLTLLSPETVEGVLEGGSDLPPGGPESVAELWSEQG